MVRKRPTGLGHISCRHDGVRWPGVNATPRDGPAHQDSTTRSGSGAPCRGSCWPDVQGRRCTGVLAPDQPDRTGEAPSAERARHHVAGRPRVDLRAHVQRRQKCQPHAHRHHLAQRVQRRAFVVAGQLRAGLVAERRDLIMQGVGGRERQDVSSARSSLSRFLVAQRMVGGHRHGQRLPEQAGDLEVRPRSPAAASGSGPARRR
jgi:hypothetical protein